MVKIGGTQELSELLETFRQDVIADVLQYRIDHNKQWSRRADERDYPHVVTACEFGKEMAAGRSERAHCYIKRSNPLHPLVLRPIILIAPLSKPIPFCESGKNYGTCAEDDAATKVLNQITSTMTPLPTVKELVFAQPVRTRTQEPKPCCDVCEYVFG